MKEIQTHIDGIQMAKCKMQKRSNIHAEVQEKAHGWNLNILKKQGIYENNF